jgi:hypothetical protein
MPIDEQDLRQRLHQAAGQASPPGFSVEGLARRALRRRTRFIAAASASAAVIVAIAIAVPVLLGGASRQPMSVPAGPLPKVSCVVTVNGLSRACMIGGPLPRYPLTPGESLAITVDVRVPAGARFGALWLGIVSGTFGGGSGGPTGMSPVLASSQAPLGPGVHRFTGHWVAPDPLRSGHTRWLALAWTTTDADSGGFIAALVT